MVRNRTLAVMAAVATLALAAMATPDSAEARLFRRASAESQNFILTNVTSANSVAGGVTPDCCAPVPACCVSVPCCKPNVCYKYCGLRKACCDPCLPPIKQTLTFCHPCTGCKVDVDLCLPGCCTGCPKVCHRRTLIGCGAVTYEWCCGVSATIRFQKCGDVTVIYRGV